MAGQTKNIWIIIGVLVVAAIGFAWFFSSSGSAPSLVTETASTTTSTTQTVPTKTIPIGSGTVKPPTPVGSVTGPTGIVITYTSKGFSPTYLEIKVGKAVTFINKSSGAMRVISTQVPLINGLPNAGFDEGNAVGLNGTFTFNLSAPGEWHYKSFFRPDFTGTIVVTPQ